MVLNENGNSSYTLFYGTHIISGVAVLMRTSYRFSVILEVLNENHNSGRYSMRTANRFSTEITQKLYFSMRTDLRFSMKNQFYGT